MNKRAPPSSTIADRVVRVFVSSTFRDMQEERNYLLKHVFPELKKRCRERAVEFVEVDLRWVSEEASLDQQTIKIFLPKLRHCQEVIPRPSFVVLLGDRYGCRHLPYGGYQGHQPGGGAEAGSVTLTGTPRRGLGGIPVVVRMLQVPQASQVQPLHRGQPGPVLSMGPVKEVRHPCYSQLLRAPDNQWHSPST
jgi:hypothetical protein